MWTVAADNPPFFNSLGTSTQKRGEESTRIIRIADTAPGPGGPRHQLTDSEPATAPKSTLRRRPAGRTDANRLTTVRIDQPPTPRRLNEIQTQRLVPGASVTTFHRHQAGTGSRSQAKRQGPSNHDIGPDAGTERRPDRNEEEEHQDPTRVADYSFRPPPRSRKRSTAARLNRKRLSTPGSGGTGKTPPRTRRRMVHGEQRNRHARSARSTTSGRSATRRTKMANRRLQ